MKWRICKWRIKEKICLNVWKHKTHAHRHIWEHQRVSGTVWRSEHVWTLSSRRGRTKQGASLHPSHLNTPPLPPFPPPCLSNSSIFHRFPLFSLSDLLLSLFFYLLAPFLSPSYHFLAFLRGAVRGWMSHALVTQNTKPQVNKDALKQENGLTPVKNRS